MWIATVIALLLAVSSCIGGADSPPAEASPTATAVRNVLATRRVALPTVPLPTATAIPQTTETPTAVPTAPVPVLSPPTTAPSVQPANGFCCLYFAAGPFAQAADTFPAGTEIIYAIWDYTNLSPEDRIRRIWLRDDLIWLAREEKWDWDKYGAAGTVRDLSIFDFEGDGLQSGSYRLQLYLNDMLQEEAAFVILPP